MPQLELADFPSQIFWLIVTFSFLYIVLARVTLPSISGVLKNRQRRITDDLEKAESLKQEALNAEQDFTSALEEARKNAAALLSKANDAVAEEEAKQFAKLESTFEKQSQEAEQRVKAVLSSADDVVAPVAADASIAIVKKLTGITVKKGDAETVAKKLLAS